MKIILHFPRSLVLILCILDFPSFLLQERAHGFFMLFENNYSDKININAKKMLLQFIFSSFNLHFISILYYVTWMGDHYRPAFFDRTDKKRNLLPNVSHYAFVCIKYTNEVEKFKA